MDYCLASNQIGSYVDAGYISTRNIDCVTLDADTVTCTNLTIDGVEIDTNLTNIMSATQHQTATTNPQTTTFTGEVNADQILAASMLTDNIQAPSGTLTVNSPLTTSSSFTANNTISVNNTTATSTTQLAQLYAPNQTSGATGVLVGKNSSSLNSLALQHYYTASGSTSNYGQIALANQPGPQIYSTYTNIPNQLQINGAVALPRQIGTITTMTGAGPFSFTAAAGADPSVQKFVISIVDMNINGTTNAVPFLRWGYNGSFQNNAAGYTGFNWGNNAGATIQWNTGLNGIPLWNSNNLPASPASYFISGTIECTFAGFVGGYQKWTVRGYIGTPNMVSTAGPYWVYISGYMTTYSGFPRINGMQIIKNSTNFTSGYCNILYY